MFGDLTNGCPEQPRWVFRSSEAMSRTFLVCGGRLEVSWASEAPVTGQDASTDTRRAI